METHTTERKVDTRAKELEVMLPDTRGVSVSRWGSGNLKLGPDVVTYSRLPGRPRPHGGTCPGATAECISICYAFAINDGSPVWDVYRRNSETPELPEDLPEGTKFVRWHVSGDFDTTHYIHAWISFVQRYPDVKFWGYTRAWRVYNLIDAIEELRAQPNVQLFASMDGDSVLPPDGWRRSWLSNDPRGGYEQLAAKLEAGQQGPRVLLGPGVSTLLCPEETGGQPDCAHCRYCITAKRGDVTFIIH